ncbi:ribonuclease H-like domain-containing protein, partial [Tanacetum coccineum]
IHRFRFQFHRFQTHAHPYLKLTVGHHNGTLAKITHVGNLKLNNNVILFDVLVVPDYTDLKKGKVLGTGSEFAGLYLFDEKYNASSTSYKSEYFACYVSKDIWHHQLGHPANQVLNLLKGSLNLNHIKHDLPCEVCHKAKQSMEPFPLSETKSTIFGQLIHLDVWVLYKVVSREEFSPNDDEEGSPSGRDGNDIVAPQPGYDELQSATPVDEINSSEGNVGINPEVPIFQNIFENQNEEVNLIRSSRTSKFLAKLNDYVLNNTVRYCLNKYANHSMLSVENCAFVTSLNKSCEPSSFEEASKDVNWINAMNNEMHALYENNTLELVDLPYGRKPIGSRWVYKIKYMSTGEIERDKARVVAKGYHQKEGINYEETFSPIVKMSTVRCLIDLDVQRDWKLYQMDVNNAFLSLYGLKQAPRQCNHKLYDTLLEASFEQSKNDHSLYIKNDNNVSLFLLVYIDDLVITGNFEVEIDKFKTFLNKKFKMKDPGELKYFLGIEVLKTKTSLCLNQRKYYLELLHEFGLLACRPVLTPLPENIVLAHKETKDDNQHMHAPLQSHFNLTLRLLRYLKLAPGSGIDFSKDNSGIQPTLSKSSAKAEYRAMTATTCEAMWIVKILKDLGLKDFPPVELHCDNKAAIQIAANPVMHEKTKHFDLDVHFEREKVASGLIKTIKVDTKCQVADIFTKDLGSFQHNVLVKSLRMINMFQL